MKKDILKKMKSNMKIEDGKVLFQIGTNTGEDDFNKIVKASNPLKVILVEPNSDLNEKIYKSYKNIDIILENVAITEVSVNEVKLVIPKNGKSDDPNNRHSYGPSCFSLLPLDNWGDSFDYLISEGLSFNDLCKKHNINDIHYLQIDTEGYDATIINSIDFENINIDIIRYEYWDFPERMFSKHSDKSKCGINGMDRVNELLTSLGYTIKIVRCSKTGERNAEAIKNK